MVDTPAASETVFRLIYRSHMRIASDVRKSELGEISASPGRTTSASA